jgi:hypothetical protein
MGSFNITCFATNQTIACGDRCWVLPVVQQSSYQAATVRMRDGAVREVFGATSSTAYPNAFWQPFACYVPAVYDDYGNTTLVLTKTSRPAVLYLLQTLLVRSLCVDEGENVYHDLPFNLPAFLEERAPALLAFLRSADANALFSADVSDHDEAVNVCWEYVSRAAFKGRTFATNAFGAPRPLQLAVMHDEAYHALALQAQKGRDWDGDRLEVTAFLLAKVRKAREAAAKDSRDGEAPLHKHLWFVDRLRAALDSIKSSSQYPQGLEIAYMHHLLRAATDSENNDEVLVEGLVPYVTGRYVMAGLEQHNLRLSPMAPCDQDYSNDIGTRYAELVSSVSKKVAAQRSVL